MFARCLDSGRQSFHKVTVFAFLLAFGVQPICAWGQYAPDASMDLGIGYGQMALGQAAINGTRAIGITSERAFKNNEEDAPEPTVPVPGSLTFKSTPAVTHVVNRRVAAWLSEEHPEMLAETEEDVGSGRLQGYFADILYQYQYDSANLADVSAAFYISLWTIIHGRDLTPRQVLGVRDQMRAFMAEDVDVMQLPDAEKQEISETFTLHAALVLQSYEQLLQEGDTRTLVLFRQGLQTNLAPQGPDILSLDVSEDGFVAGR